MTSYAFPKEQSLKSLRLKDYANRVIVCGSRGFSDKVLFHEKIMEYLEEFTEPVLFISGAAPTGADDLIIRWCQKFNYPCKQVPADWDTQGKRAGFLRNTKMAEMATHVLAFYDGTSPGTKHMLEEAEERKLIEKIIVIGKADYGNTNNPKSARVSGCNL